MEGLTSPRSQGFSCFLPRTGAGAAQEAAEDMHRQDDEHQEPVEEHRGAMCELVSSCDSMTVFSQN